MKENLYTKALYHAHACVSQNCYISQCQAYIFRKIMTYRSTFGFMQIILSLFCYKQCCRQGTNKVVKVLL